jgi:hypothetical protein
MKPVVPWYFKVINSLSYFFGPKIVNLNPELLIKAVTKELGITIQPTFDGNGEHGGEIIDVSQHVNRQLTINEINEITKHVARYVNSVATTANLSVCGGLFFKLETKSILRERIRVELYHKMFPNTKDIVIDDPIIITGLPRTGSTILSRLLACDKKRVRPLLFWESNRPAPVLDKRGNIVKTGEKDAAKELAMLLKTIPHFKVIHLLDNCEPEECVFILRQYFVSWMSTLTFDIPEYKQYLMSEEGMKEIASSYVHHKKSLQVLSSLDSKRLQCNDDHDKNQEQDQEQKEGGHKKRWLIKSPYHMFGADAIVEQYPKAKFICLHRDPVEVFPSFASLIALGRPVYSKRYNAVTTGKDVTEVLIKGLDTFEYYRTDCKGRGESDNVLDIRYEDIVEHPIDVIKKIYNFVGFGDVDFDTEESMIAYLGKNPQNKHGVHQYSLEEFGIDGEQLKSQLSWYYKKYLTT